MRHFNLVKSLTRVINNRKGLLILCLSLAVLGVNEVWGHDTHTGKITVSIATGKGTVYVAESNTATSGSTEGSIDCGGEEKKDKNSKTFYIFAKPNNGYSFSKWDDNDNTSPRSISITPKSGTKNYAATFTAHTYKVNFDGNGATGGSMNQQTLTYDQTSLATNAFTRSYTINFDADGGSAADSKIATYTFNNWNTKADGTGTTYTNQQQNLTTENGATINLYAQWKSASITLPSSTRSGYVLDGWFSGDTKIGNSGDSYTPTTNISLKAKWTGKYNPDFSYTGATSYNVGDGSIDLQQLWTSTGDGAITYSKISFTPASGQQSGSTEPAITHNRYLSLNKAGTLKIHLEQAETSSYYAGNADLTITISRIANTLAVEATHTMKVDETWSGVISGKNSDATVTTTTSDGTIAYYDVANNKIVAPNSSAKSFNSTDVTITISQEATYKYTAVEKTIKVTVNKHVPTFTWSNATLYHNQTYNDFFSTNGTNALMVKSSSDDNVAYLVDGANAQKLNLKTLTKAASTTLTVTQAENYYWAEHTESKTITPGYASNHVPFTIGSDYQSNGFYVTNSGQLSWNDGIQLGPKSAGNWDDKTIILTFTGIPQTLTFDIDVVYNDLIGPSGVDWWIKESADGSNWSDKIWTNDNRNASNQSVSLKSSTRYLTFCYSGNFGGVFKNIKVTELKTFSAEPTSLDFGTQQKQIACESKAFTFKYANVGHKVTLSTNDPHFTVSPTSITNIGGEKYGSQTITVSYNTNEVHTASGAKITISDELGNSTTVNLSGKTILRSNAITWNPNATDKKNHGEVVTMEATSNNTDYTNYPITFTSSNTNYATVDGNKVTFLAAGAGLQVTITANQAESNTYKSASLSKTFTIKSTQSLTYKDSQVNVSIAEEDDIETIDISTLFSAQTGDGVITYAIKSGEGGVLNGTTFYSTVANDVVITATAERTADYETVSKDFTIHVVKRTPTITWKTFEHIYAGAILEDVASTSYNSNPVTLIKTYESHSDAISLDTEDNTELHVSSTITEEQKAEVKVTTTETPFYKSVEETKSYTLEPKATPIFYLNDNVLSQEEISELHLEIGKTANVRFELTDESNFEYPTSTSTNYFTYEHNTENHTGVITATKWGDETFAFHQKGTTTIFDHLCQIHIYVSKHQSVLTTPLTDGTWKVDSLYTGSVYSSNDTHEVIVSTSDENVLKVTPEGIKAVGAGSATLYIRQETTDEWTGDTISVNINVEKYTPEITWNIDTNLPWGSVINNPISTSNTELPYSITSSNPSISNYVNEHIEVYNTSGSVTYTFAQEGNYKWNAANSSKTITIFQPANHVPFTLSQGNYGNFVNSYNKECTWNSGLRVASTAAKYAFDWDDRYVILHFEGIPDKLYFSCSNSDASTGTDFYVCEGSSQSNLTQIWSASKATKDVQLQLQPNTRYIKLCFSGNYAGYFSNVQVTERKEVVASTTSCDFGSANVGAATSKKSISVDWYNVQTCTLTISGTNADRFSVNPTSISSSLDNYGKESIEISYLHTISGSHSATLTIQSADGKSANVSLSGTTNKVTPTITWIENLSPMEKGSTKENPAQAGGLIFTYESSDPSVIEIVNGNTLHALKKGFANITATFDGTHDVMWNSASDTTMVEVTDIKVLRIDWPQSFSNLKVGKPDIPIQATVYYYNFEDSTTVAIDRPIIFESQNTNIVSIEAGNVHIVGKGETTITATVEGVEDEYIGTTVTRKVKVREPSEGCDMYVLEDANGSLFTEITSFTGVQKEFNLSGEPEYISFDAWSEKWSLISPSGNLKLAEYYDGSYHTIWDQTLNVDNETSYGPIKLNRKTTKIKFFKEVGSTCYHNFASAYVTLAKYLELDNTQGKTTMSIDFPETETATGITYTKYVDVNFSNISDALDVDIKHGTNFSVLKNDLSGKIENIGEDCGEKGEVTLAIQFLSNKVDNYKDTIIISNKDQSATIYLSAEVARHDQQITWNPNTNLLTTDQVTFSATTTATDLHVSYAVKGTSEVASVTPDGILTIYKSGEVTIVASQAGSKDYKPAENVERTFNISRVTPTITTLPIAAEVVLPKTLAGCTLAGGEASVSGTFAWTNTTTQIERGNTGYEVTFTPSNLNYYTPTTCIVVVPVAKDPQTITWNFNETTMYCNAQITFDATASSGLPVTYTTSNSSIAYVDGSHKLCIVKGGEVIITAKQVGNETWAAAPDVNKALVINRFTPTIVENPVAESMLIGQLLSNASLSGGRAELNSQVVPGSFAWENGNSITINEAGIISRTVIFTPQNSNYYESVSCEVSVEVKKYAPTITNNLSATAITYGQALSASVLNGTLTAMDNVKYPSVEVEGTFGWFAPTLMLNAGGQTAIVRFSPTNSDWYNYVDIEIPVQVNKATANATPSAAAIKYGQKVSESNLTNGGTTPGTWTWTDAQKDEILPVGVHDHLSVHFVPTDNANYLEADGEVSLTVNKATPTLTWTEKANAANALEQKTFTASSTNTDDNAAITYSITTGTDCATIDATTGVVTMIKKGTITITASQAATDNFTEASAISTTCEISPAPTQIVTLPTINDGTPIEIGTQLNGLVLTGGEVQNTINNNGVEGTFAITGGNIFTVGATSITITFTPNNTEVYAGCSTNAEVTIHADDYYQFTGNDNTSWTNGSNWGGTKGTPSSDEDAKVIIVSGTLDITSNENVNVTDLTILPTGTVHVHGDLSVNGTTIEGGTYGDLFVHNGGIATIGNDASLTVNNFVIETSIGTEGQSASGQVHNESNIIYTTGAYIDINMDPSGKMDDTQWYAFTVPFPVDVQNGVARKEGDVFRKCTYGVEYFIAEYDMTQRLNTGKGWKYIKSGQLQPGRFYYFTVNGDYNVYSFKAAENTITINNTTELKVNGTGANANWNAVGNTTLTYATISGENVPAYVQTYVNGESRYITVATSEAQFVVGCPFFFQASEEATMILNEANETVDTHYAPRQESVDKPVCVRIAEEDKHFSDQIYLTASQEATGEYTLGRDLAKAGIGTKSAQLWMNAYGQKLSVQDATLMGDQAYYELSIYAPKAGSYELSLPKVPANAVIYLTQDGYPIWNLNEMPYVIECYKGTTNEYGLLLRLQEGGSPTDMQTMRGSEKVQKIMKNQRIYINANSQLYDLMGQKVK